MKSPQAKSIRFLQERHQENLEVMLKNLHRDETLSDITIHCRDGSVRAHRVILAASSPYFKKLFQEHPEHQVAFLLHGVAVKLLKSLIELIYRGSTQIPSDLTTKFCDVAEEFGMKGIVDENDKCLLNASGRDTRFRGQKRVVVDFENDSSETQIRINPPKFVKNGCEKTVKRFSSENLVNNPYASSLHPPTNHPLDSLGLVPTAIKQEPHSPSTSNISSLPVPSVPLSAEARRRNNWAMKQRKYKCSLCPASFKRASHLSRHQLVHTGERPYACGQCDKAFSRHDKLKHHIRKTHPNDYVGNMIESSAESDVYTIGNVEIDTPHNEMCEEPTRVTREDLLARMQPLKVEREHEVVPEEPSSAPQITGSEASSDPEPVSETTDHTADSAVGSDAAPKKGRGRPRKYPPVPRPLIKRPRGRPRLHQAGSLIRPDFKQSRSEKRGDNYDITNMPFGDLEYLTKPVEQNSDNEPNANIMEPLVEIELDQNNAKKPREEEPAREEEENTTLAHNTAGAFLQNIGLLETSSLAKMEIGECTISVSSGPGLS